MAAPFRIALIAAAAAVATATPAGAAERCVDPERVECHATVAEAVAAADSNDSIVVAGEHTATEFSDEGKTLWIRGLAGAALLAPVELTGAGSRLSGLRLAPADGAAALVVDGVTAAADDLDIRLPARADGIVVRCGELTARHLTITGDDDVFAGVASCTDPTSPAELELRSSVLDGPAEPDPGLNGSVAMFFSFTSGDLGLGPDRRPLAGSPVVDAGDPAALAPGEPFEDAAGLARVTDGNGDGALRRDAGAYELQPPPVPLPAGNVLTNPGAEDGTTGWTGTFLREAFGDPFFPTAAAGQALGAGAAFFGGGGAADPSSMQRIGVSGSARAIDAGGATARLSGLLGGYGAEADEVRLRAVFRDPEGFPIPGELTLGPVTAGDRGRATNLLFREARGAIPARTRAIDVVLDGHRADGSYTDAYADNLGLELSVPGAPTDPTDPIVPNLRPFTGVIVLHPHARVTRAGTARIALACASSTVRSCSGTLELRARLPKAAEVTRIARFAKFDVKRGRARGVYVKLLAAARRALRGRTSIRATLRAVAADGQGVQRTRTVPLKLRLPRRR